MEIVFKERNQFGIEDNPFKNRLHKRVCEEFDRVKYLIMNNDSKGFDIEIHVLDKRYHTWGALHLTTANQPYDKIDEWVEYMIDNLHEAIEKEANNAS